MRRSPANSIVLEKAEKTLGLQLTDDFDESDRFNGTLQAIEDQPDISPSVLRKVVHPADDRPELLPRHAKPPYRKNMLAK